MALHRIDLIIKHKPVDQHGTDLTEKNRRYILRVLSRKIKEDTLLTSLSCKESKTAVELLIGISGLGISVNLIDKEYEGINIVTGHNIVAYEINYHTTDTFGSTELGCIDIKACLRKMNKVLDNIQKVIHLGIIREELKESRISHLILDLLYQRCIVIGLKRIVAVSEVIVIIPVRLTYRLSLDLLRKKLDIKVCIILRDGCQILLDLIDTLTDLDVV